MDFGGTTTYGTAIRLLLVDIIYVFQPVFAYTFFQEYLAGGAGSGLDEFHLGITREAHDVHVGSSEFVDIPEGLHHILFGVNTRPGIS